MNTKNVTFVHSAPTCPPPHNDTAAPAAADYGIGDCGGVNTSEPRLILYLRVVATFCWTASRGTLQRLLFSYLESIFIRIWSSLVVVLRRAGRAGPVASSRGPQKSHHSPVGTRGEALSAPTTSPKKVAWSYLRGVSLALSELCQECNYGGSRIPLSGILDLMRQHQSAFVPLGPHVEKDVPRRLVQLANENAIFFDPFEEYVIVPELTREKYAERRQELLAEGVDPANLSVFGAAFTQHLSASKRVTNAAVANYKERFLLTKRRQDGSHTRRVGLCLTREESLMSIADAICPATLIQQEQEERSTPEGDHTIGNTVLRRGQSIVMDIIGYRGCSVVEGTGVQGTSQLRRGNSVLQELSAIIHQRDALEVENSRLRTIAEQC